MLALLRPCSLTGGHTKHLCLKLLTAAMRTRGHQQAKKSKMMTQKVMGSVPAKPRISQMERSPPEGVCSSGKIALQPDRWGIFFTHCSCACDMHCCREGLDFAHVAGSCYGWSASQSVCQITFFPLGLIRCCRGNISSTTCTVMGYFQRRKFKSGQGSYIHNVIGQVAPAAQRRPVWEDEEDETVEVNIAGRNRLRKLRQTEEETVLTGTSSASIVASATIYRVSSNPWLQRTHMKRHGCLGAFFVVGLRERALTGRPRGAGSSSGGFTASGVLTAAAFLDISSNAIPGWQGRIMRRGCGSSTASSTCGHPGPRSSLRDAQSESGDLGMISARMTSEPPSIFCAATTPEFQSLGSLHNSASPLRLCLSRPKAQYTSRSLGELRFSAAVVDHQPPVV
jgi:hypothetical protein